MALLQRADPASRQVVPTYRAAQEQVTLTLGRVHELESLLNVQERWSPTSPEYQATLKYTGERRYRRMLDILERLVVQRLFELEKTNMVGTGEHIRSRTCSTH